ncbi:MAG: hypothetical protein MRY32_04485 [Rickettsiales bacterium]|nr:hypothetical protein [Rickettsiales bacterium]
MADLSGMTYQSLASKDRHNYAHYKDARQAVERVNGLISDMFRTMSNDDLNAFRRLVKTEADKTSPPDYRGGFQTVIDSMREQVWNGYGRRLENLPALEANSNDWRENAGEYRLGFRMLRDQIEKEYQQFDRGGIQLFQSVEYMRGLARGHKMDYKPGETPPTLKSFISISPSGGTIKSMDELFKQLEDGSVGDVNRFGFGLGKQSAVDGKDLGHPDIKLAGMDDGVQRPDIEDRRPKGGPGEGVA